MKQKKPIAIMVMAFLFISVIFTILFANTNGNYKVENLSYNEFLTMVDDKKVDNVNINFKADTFTFRSTDGKLYKTDNPKYDNFKKDLLEKNVKVNVKTEPNVTGTLLSLIKLSFTGLLVFMMLKFARQQLGSGKNTQVIMPEENDRKKEKRTTFDDVAGLHEVKEDMQIIIDMLKDPTKYNDAGAKLPKGVILRGPAGTGKTLLARAVAGEAGVPFFSASGSDFVEKYVGQGASRVRELFKEAQAKAPCIVFIDEIDALGGKREDGGAAGQEHNQTVNAFLTCVDGFGCSDGIIVIGATNRFDSLDKAFIRPGRFDKHVTVPLPQTPEERLEIINIYAKDKKFSDDVNFDALAKETIGFSPAAIESLLNESAIISVGVNEGIINKNCIEEAMFKVIMEGHMKKDKTRDMEQLKLIAHHEAGHAVLAKLSDVEVSKVTIIPSTSGAGGVNIIVPKKMGLHSIDEMRADVRISYAGRCAEYLLYGDWNKTTTGASSDIESATSTIYQMISVYGMTDDFGMLNLNNLKIDNDKILDKAVALSNELKKETLELLKEHKAMHQEIVDVLLEKETISGDELDEIYSRHMALTTKEEA